MLYIDRRELQEHANIPQLVRVPYTIDTLDASDYAFLDRDSEPIGIERCEINNFLQKMRDGELESQMGRCSANFSNTILLIEGIFECQDDGLLMIWRGRNARLSGMRYDTTIAALIRMSEFGIEIFQTPDFKCSMTFINMVYLQRTSPLGESTLFKRTRVFKMPTKYTTNPAVSKLMGLCPRLSEKVAIRLIYKYNTIWDILHQPDNELLQIEGFGKGFLETLKKTVGRP